LGEQGIDSAYITGFEAMITEAHQRTSAAGMAKDEAKTETAAAVAAAKALQVGLQKIQSSAKQKSKMLEEDSDPATSFPVDGYLIGTRIAESRAVLCQSATTLIGRAELDSLPGFLTPEKIKVIKDLLKDYKDTYDIHKEGTMEKELARLNRDQLIHVLNIRRSAIQHAADAIWSYTDELNHPKRKSFDIPQNRPLGFSS
ncbi:unnamed protein product, partial [Laminaria digitata]